MYYCEIWDSYPFFFSSMDTRQLQFLLFDYWTLYCTRTYILLWNTGQDRFFFSFIWLCTVKLLWNTGQLYPFSFSSVDTIGPCCCEIRDSYCLSSVYLLTLYGRMHCFEIYWTLCGHIAVNTVHLPFLFFVYWTLYIQYSHVACVPMSGRGETCQDFSDGRGFPI